MIKDSDFTTDTLGELDRLVKNKENAFDLLIKNLRENGLTDVDSTKVVGRLQTQYIAENRKDGDLRTIEDWDQKEYYEPNEVNDDIPAVIKGRYSSFALLKIDDSTELSFPLLEDYSSIYQPFAKKSFSDASFATNISNLVNKLGVVVKQNDLYKFSIYKRGFVNSAIIKVKNKVLSLFKKPVKVVGLFSGKISLKTKINNYVMSNVEKITKIYDFILNVAIKAEAKNFKEQMGDKAKEIKYVARLFADVLMARVNDLGNINNNKKLEKCLWLQFANALNKYNFDSNQLKLITELGVKATVTTCKNLGITKEKIIERMNALGYVYTCVPSNEQQALTEIKQKDYSVYSQASAERKEEQDLSFAKTSLKNETKEQVETQTEVKKETKQETKTEKQEQEAKAGQNQTPYKKEIVVSQERAQVKKSTIEKMIDKAVIKFLADQGTKNAENINALKVKGKKLKVAETELNLYILMLSYYVQATSAKPMSVKNDGTFNESEISKAKLIVKALIYKRQELVEKTLNCKTKKSETQSTTAYINSVCKSLCNENVRDYFLKLIRHCVAYCVKMQFDNGKQQEPNETEINALLESASRVLDDSKTEEKTDYVPNFVIVDEGEPPKSELKPNFVFVSDKEQTK